jgi:hypothetical protein
MKILAWTKTSLELPAEITITTLTRLVECLDARYSQLTVPAKDTSHVNVICVKIPPDKSSWLCFSRSTIFSWVIVVIVNRIAEAAQQRRRRST